MTSLLNAETGTVHLRDNRFEVSLVERQGLEDSLWYVLDTQRSIARYAQVFDEVLYGPGGKKLRSATIVVENPDSGTRHELHADEDFRCDCLAAEKGIDYCYHRLVAEQERLYRQAEDVRLHQEAIEKVRQQDRLAREARKPQRHRAAPPRALAPA